MLKKTLIATGVVGATLLAAAAVLPALAQSRGTALASPAATGAQAPVLEFDLPVSDPGSHSKRISIARRL